VRAECEARECNASVPRTVLSAPVGATTRDCAGGGNGRVEPG